MREEVLYIRDRKEREEYLDDLERQMGCLREQMQRTLSSVEGSGRRRTVLNWLRGSLPGLPGRAPAQITEESREDSGATSEGQGPTATPPDPERVAQAGKERRPWWRSWG
jgi:hypothetical protein